jgi:hypothetical protein
MSTAGNEPENRTGAPQKRPPPPPGSQSHDHDGDADLTRLPGVAPSTGEEIELTSRVGDDQAVRKIIREHYDRGDSQGWFETLYAWAGDDPSKIPWADKRPNKNLVSWLQREQVRGHGRSACVVGCGLGDDAELLARHGFKVTAFDLSKSAIDWCARRFPGSRVAYRQADLLNLPPEFVGGFEFVFEAYTLQTLPRSLRARGIDAVASLPKRGGGELLVICRGRDEQDDPGDLPWPLTSAEIARFDAMGLRRLSSEDYMDDEDPPVRRFRVLWTAPSPGTPGA